MLELRFIEKIFLVALPEFAVEVFQLLYGSAEEGCSFFGIQLPTFFLLFFRFESRYEFGCHYALNESWLSFKVCLFL